MIDVPRQRADIDLALPENMGSSLAWISSGYGRLVGYEETHGRSGGVADDKGHGRSAQLASDDWTSCGSVRLAAVATTCDKSRRYGPRSIGKVPGNFREFSEAN